MVGKGKKGGMSSEREDGRVIQSGFAVLYGSIVSEH